MANPATVQIMEAARQHFARQGSELIEVPEWGAPGNPVKIKFNPISARDRRNIDARAGKGAHRAAMFTVLLYARDPQSGELMFEDNAETVKWLDQEVDPGVVEAIALKMLGQDETGGKSPAPSE